MRSPALTSWSTPAIVALPLPEVKVRIWSTVCFYGGERRVRTHYIQGGFSERLSVPRSVERPTSSPISPFTGTVISTSWLYSPVHKTRRKSPDSLGSDVVMFRKYAISCFGGSSEGVLKFMLVVVKCRMAGIAVLVPLPMEVARG